MSATLADIAKVAQTSISTVSRVLADAPAAQRISEALRLKIARVAKEMGYRPNLLARSLRTRRTHTIAVLVSDIANPWFGQLASLIEQELHKSGYTVMLCNSCEDAELEQEYLHLLTQKGIDGLIIVPLATQRQSLISPLPVDLPLVVVDRPVADMQASVTSDQQQAARLLCEQMEKIGVKRVALVRGPGHVITHRLRADAVRDRFEVVVEHEGPAQPETGRAAWAKARGHRVDAAVCTNNFLGQGVIDEMANDAQRTPVACFDELPVMDLLPMPIVCCVQDVPRLAGEAVSLLLRQLEGPQSPCQVVVPARVVWNRAFNNLRGV